MADQQRKEILVYSHPSVLKEPILMGTLNTTIVRGRYDLKQMKVGHFWIMIWKPLLHQ